MKKVILLICPLLIAVSACSPRIGSTVLKQYPALDVSETVSVYSRPQQVPAHSEVLGSVVAADAGATTKCDSSTMIGLVKEEAKKIGGNAVLITKHVRPSIWASSCHQFEGTILRVDPAGDTLPSDDLTAAAYLAEPESKGRKLPRFTFGADGGVGWRLNRPNDQMPAIEKVIYNNLRFAPSWNAYADYFFSDHYGIRLSYQASHASASEYVTIYDTEGDRTLASGKMNAYVQISYVGPAFVMRGASKKQKWLYDVAIGLGYLHYKENWKFPNYFITSSGSTVGALLSIGLEYKFAENWGFGFNLLETSGIMTQVNVNQNGAVRSVSTSANEGNGVARLELLFGVRFHIK
jgi:hypothetical protein